MNTAQRKAVEMASSKAQVAASLREEVDEYFSLHYLPSERDQRSKRYCIPTMETIPEIVICTHSGEEIGEDDTHPGGMWEHLVDWQHGQPSAVPSSEEDLYEHSSEGAFTRYNTPETPIFPMDSQEQLRALTSLGQDTPTSNITEHNSIEQDEAVEERVPIHTTALFADFPTCIIKSKRLGVVDDDKYGHTAITRDSAWKHITYNDLPSRVCNWIASFIINHAFEPSYGPVHNLATTDSHNWLFETPSTDFVYHTISLDMWYRAHPAEPSTKPSAEPFTKPSAEPPTEASAEPSAEQQ